jgi:hypothetical protein
MLRDRRDGRNLHLKEIDLRDLHDFSLPPASSFSPRVPLPRNVRTKY